MARKLKDSTVVITGASSGIGRATAIRFARKGANVVLAARRADLLEDVAARCRQAGGRALAVPTDVTDEQQVLDLARRAVEEFGRIDVWVNNASVSLFGRIDEAPPQEYDRVIDTNLLGYVRGVRAALPYMRQQGEGVIVNNASVYGKVGAALISSYTSSKFGVVGLGESLRQELVHEPGIRVSTVLPASIDTPLFQHAANYTGRRVKPLRPVYDAHVVAREIVRAAHTAPRERIVGGTGRILRRQRMMNPKTFERVQARMVEKDHFEDIPQGPTSGNVNEPVPWGREVSGGWPSSPGPIRRAMAPLLAVKTVAVLGAAGAAAAALRGGAGARLGLGLGTVGARAAALAAPPRDPVTRGTNPVVRSVRDLGLYTWFGGTLMGALAADRAAGAVSDPAERLRFADSAWDRWTVPAGLAITTHLLGSAVLGWANKSRLAGQRGLATLTAAKAVLSAAALGATLAGRITRKQAAAGGAGGAGLDAPAADATTPLPETPAHIGAAQRRLRAAEVAVPALTGAIVVLNAVSSEEQRPLATLRGVMARIRPGA